MSDGLPLAARTAAIGVLLLGGAIRADEAVLLQETFRPGDRATVSTRVKLSGSLTLPPEKDKPAQTLAMTGESAIDYDERLLEVSADGQVTKTIRLYRLMEFRRKMGDQPQASALRDAVRRLVVMRMKPREGPTVEVPFSPDGPLTVGEIDQVRADVFTPALAGLLPDRPVKPGDRWAVATSAIEELTDLEKVEQGGLQGRFEEVVTLAGRRYARLALTGTVTGVNEDGPNRQTLEATVYFDLTSKHLSRLVLLGVHSLLDKDGKETGRVEGQFTLTRQVGTTAVGLDDAALKGVGLAPTPDNTLLLFESPELGLRMTHPRRWRPSAARGRQVTFDEPRGAGVLVTLDPIARVPTGAQFLEETRAFLTQQKATIRREGKPTRLASTPRELEHFALEADIESQRVWLDYYVIRQPELGATLAARLLPDDLDAQRRDIERMARSIVLTKPQTPAPSSGVRLVPPSLDGPK